MVGKSINSCNVNKGGKKFGGVRKPYDKQRVNNIWMNCGSNSGHGHGHITISNLHHRVDDADIKTLFMEFGKITSATVQYNQAGRSLGTALVKFQRHADAIRALERYNGVPLDGRPMKIQILVSGTPSVFDRLNLTVFKKFNGPRDSKYQTKSAPRRDWERKSWGERPHQKSTKVEFMKGTYMNGGQKKPTLTKVFDKNSAYVTVGSRRGPNVHKASNHKKPTKEELDAELDAYMNGAQRHSGRKIRKAETTRANSLCDKIPEVTIVDSKAVDEKVENVDADINNDDQVFGNEVSEADLLGDDESLIDTLTINDENGLIDNVDATINNVSLTILISQDHAVNDSINDLLNDSLVEVMDVN